VQSEEVVPLQAAQELSHWEQEPPAKNCPAAQEVHAVGPGPLQVRQETSHS